MTTTAVPGLVHKVCRHVAQVTRSDRRHVLVLWHTRAISTHWVTTCLCLLSRRCTALGVYFQHNVYVYYHPGYEESTSSDEAHRKHKRKHKGKEGHKKKAKKNRTSSKSRRKSNHGEGVRRYTSKSRFVSLARVSS